MYIYVGPIHVYYYVSALQNKSADKKNKSAVCLKKNSVHQLHRGQCERCDIGKSKKETQALVL